MNLNYANFIARRAEKVNYLSINNLTIHLNKDK